MNRTQHPFQLGDTTRHTCNYLSIDNFRGCNGAERFDVFINSHRTSIFSDNWFVLSDEGEMSLEKVLVVRNSPAPSCFRSYPIETQ